MNFLKRLLGFTIGVGLIATSVIYTNGWIPGFAPEDEMLVKYQTKFENTVADFNKGYPASPEELVELYSDLLEVCYAEKAEEENIEQVVPMLRTLYSTELSLLNDETTQLEKFIADVDKHSQQENYLLASELVRVEYLGNEEVDKSKITVKHTMSNIQTTRDYTIQKEEDGRWALANFKDVQIQYFTPTGRDLLGISEEEGKKYEKSKDDTFEGDTSESLD
ncbi:MAG: hypothetical protein ATN31_00250 [Candidatus Epulonipiscioides saccharophilum]|nr:MAG: hypothetical protein ATN31_00250 [Epulopiscium sp. AS2M-Bin001]